MFLNIDLEKKKGIAHDTTILIRQILGISKILGNDVKFQESSKSWRENFGQKFDFALGERNMIGDWSRNFSRNFYVKYFYILYT